jgi:hypothetical protein
MTSKETADFEVRWTATIAQYRNDPTPENAVALRMMAVDYFKQRPDRRSFGPFLGIMDAVEEKHPKQKWRWLHRAVLFVVSVLLKPDQPGWNDYWMARWMVSHSLAALIEIHRRARHLAMWPQVREMGRWMVRSYRIQDPDFDRAMSAVERTCEQCNNSSGPNDGERVLFCRHFDAGPSYLLVPHTLYLYFLGDGMTRRSDGTAPFRVRWLVCCFICHRSAVDQSLSVKQACQDFAFQDSDWVGDPPDLVRVE